MITIAILINGQPIMARSATNQMRTDKKGRTAYLVDTGETIYHNRDDGAVRLARRLLDTIVEQRETGLAGAQAVRKGKGVPSTRGGKKSEPRASQSVIDDTE